MSNQKRPRPCCPTCGGPAPEPRPIQDRHHEFDPAFAIELAKRILAELPVEPVAVVAERHRDLLRDTGGYQELQEEYAYPVRCAGGVVKWVAA